MEFSLSEQQRLIQETARQFVDRELPEKRVQQWYRDKVEPPREVFQKLGELGMYGFLMPPEYSGLDEVDPLGLCVFVEQLARASSALCTIYGRAAVICGPTLAHFGSKAQKDRVLPDLIKGKVIFSLALTEPEAGSDAASLRTRAERQADGSFLINGSKLYTSQCESADWQILAARTDFQCKKQEGITLFLVEKPAANPAVTCHRLETMGLSIVPTYSVTYENLRLPADAVIGEVNQGWQALLHGLDMERFYHGAIGTGAAQAVIDKVVAYLKQRKQFDRPLSKQQVIRHKIVDMQLQTDMARLMTYRAGWMLSQQGSCHKEASMAKISGAENYMRVANMGTQLMGGFGYCVESGLPQHFTDAKLFEIGGGAMEVQRNIIAKEMDL